MRSLRELYRVLSQVGEEEEMERFLSDLCTPQELEAMAERWQVVKLLEEEIPYRQIYEMTGVSTATVTRVAKSLKLGTGYRRALDRSGRRKNVGTRSDSNRDSKSGKAKREVD